MNTRIIYNIEHCALESYYLQILLAKHIRYLLFFKEKHILFKNKKYYGNLLKFKKKSQKTCKKHDFGRLRDWIQSSIRSSRSG